MAPVGRGLIPADNCTKFFKVNVGMNCSDDLIRRVQTENYEKGVKDFETVRLILKAVFTPLLGEILAFASLINSC